MSLRPACATKQDFVSIKEVGVRGEEHGLLKLWFLYLSFSILWLMIVMSVLRNNNHGVVLSFLRVTMRRL